MVPTKTRHIHKYRCLHYLFIWERGSLFWENLPGWRHEWDAEKLEWISTRTRNKVMDLGMVWYSGEWVSIYIANLIAGHWLVCEDFLHWFIYFVCWHSRALPKCDMCIKPFIFIRVIHTSRSVYLVPYSLICNRYSLLTLTNNITRHFLVLMNLSCKICKISVSAFCYHTFMWVNKSYSSAQLHLAQIHSAFQYGCLWSGHVLPRPFVSLGCWQALLFSSNWCVTDNYVLPGPLMVNYSGPGIQTCKCSGFGMDRPKSSSI